MPNLRIFLQGEAFQLLEGMAGFSENFIIKRNDVFIINTGTQAIGCYVSTESTNPDDVCVGITRKDDNANFESSLAKGFVHVEKIVADASNIPPELQASQEMQSISLQAKLARKIDSVISAYDTHKPKKKSSRSQKRGQDHRPALFRARNSTLESSPKPKQWFLVSASHFRILLGTLPPDDRNVASLQCITKDGKNYISLPDRTSCISIGHILWKRVEPYLKEESDVTIVFDKKDFVQIERLVRATDKIAKQEPTSDKKQTYSDKLHTKMFNEKLFNEVPDTSDAALALTGKADGLQPNDESLSDGASKSSGPV